MSAGATGVGSLPGGDAREAARTATGSFEDFPYLPELPARGPGADMIGRTTGLLVDMYAHVEPSGWRISDRPGRDTRRARSWLGEDLDALEEFTQGYTGKLKIQAVGPWTLAAALELHGGEAMLQDAGACRDLAGSLAEGLREHLADVRKRIPGADVVLQLDEPSLTAVLLGRVRSASGYRTYRAVDRQVVEGALRDLFAVHDGDVVVHSCAPEVPFGLLRRAGATGVSFDFSLLTEREDDAIGEAVEGGTKLFAGVVAGTDGPLSDPGGSVMGVRKLWRRLGLAPGTLAESVVVTPSCGLAGASPAYARAVQAHCVRAARSLADNPE
ncbi:MULTISPECIES: methionine synthase [Streptomyces]|uniref:Methionine synthase n=1 Tax=Streptomyces amritsarensis TaxID=681158 RepID=A0ABX3GEF4_9ACTN|nr:MULTISPECIES: methionine synthase [Streptomyces]AQT74536.1 methionine synthase [Streptomyces sp. fd1-xmd]MDX6761835.1 methionine synthase [Streptomyces sp. F8]OLZ73925.1 methionine synthase [Streptomyces amritsarensis]